VGQKRRTDGQRVKSLTFDRRFITDRRTRRSAMHLTGLKRWPLSGAIPYHTMQYCTVRYSSRPSSINSIASRIPTEGRGWEDTFDGDEVYRGPLDPFCLETSDLSTTHCIELGFFMSRGNKQRRKPRLCDLSQSMPACLLGARPRTVTGWLPRRAGMYLENWRNWNCKYGHSACTEMHSTVGKTGEIGELN
jgi:hypothetical protein